MADVIVTTHDVSVTATAPSGACTTTTQNVSSVVLVTKKESVAVTGPPQAAAAVFRLVQMTSAQASAITPSDGLMVYVTDTNATFTTIGFWGRQSGAWVKL